MQWSSMLGCLHRCLLFCNDLGAGTGVLRDQSTPPVELCSSGCACWAPLLWPWCC